MREHELVHRRFTDWDRLKRYLARMGRRGPRALHEAELGEVATLYRKITADLAFAQTHYPYSQTVAELNALVQQAHAAIYRGETWSVRRIASYLTSGFPKTVRKARVYVAVASLVFLAGIVMGCMAVQFGWEHWLAVLPADYRELATNPERLGPGIDRGSPAFAAFVTANNIQVAFSAFSLGLTLGVGTLWILWRNGFLVGTIAWAFHARGLSVVFWSWVAPHGSVELPVIVLSGAAGLMLGKALIDPGDLRRRDALRHAANSAFSMMDGIIVLLMLAGTIEGNFSPLPLDPPVKIATGAALFLFFVSYIAFAGHETRVKRRASLSA